MKSIKNLFLGNLLLSFLLLNFSNASQAQAPEVPREMQFADLTIRINEQARREIQLDVDALHRNKIYFNNKAERAHLYFPFVERELREAGVPEDFKYLVLQESSLVADAVSSSNAVGFWQFKQGTAEEVFLRADMQIDERKNIVSSTRGAAIYLKKNNAQFDNWMCALVSYQMGLGGARAYFGSQFNGKKTIDVDRNSHWYFKKFLAHKIAFENQIGNVLVSNPEYLEELKVSGPSSLKEISKKLEVSEEQLVELNKWAVKGEIPSDKTYSVFYMKQGTPPGRPIVAQRNGAPSAPQQSQLSTTGFPKVSGNQNEATAPNQIEVNNIKGIKAPNTTSQANFAKQVGISRNRFRKLNDLGKDDPVVAGQYYYLDKKSAKADVANHVVMPRETLWSISQKYGIRLAALKAKNRIREDSDLTPGMVLNLQDHRKRGEEFVMVSGQEYRKMLEALSDTPVQESRPLAAATQSAPQPAVQPAPQTQEQPRPTLTPPTTTEEVRPSRTEPETVTENRSTVPENDLSRPTEPAPRAEPQPARTASETGRVHVVAPGETLFRLSQNYNVSVDDLKRWNNLSDNTIRVGQEIKVQATSTSASTVQTTAPASASTPSRVAETVTGSGTIIHTVVSGETLFRLGQNYGVSVDDIKKWNNLPDNTITVGQRITIYKP